MLQDCKIAANSGDRPFEAYRTIPLRAGIFKQSRGLGGIHSLESNPGLPKCLKIRAQDILICADGPVIMVVTF